MRDGAKRQKGNRIEIANDGIKNLLSMSEINCEKWSEEYWVKKKLEEKNDKEAKEINS